MATTTASIRRATISLNLPAKVADLIAYATGVVHAMTNNPAFPAPVPALAAISAAVSDLQAAETVALTRVVGAVMARDDKRAVVVSLLQQLRGYVQATADATPENGATIIQSAGFPVRKTVVRATRVFAVKPGPLRHGHGHHDDRRSPGVVRVAVQHRRGQDLGERPRHAAGPRRPSPGLPVGTVGAVPVQGRHEGRARATGAR